MPDRDQQREAAIKADSYLNIVDNGTTPSGLTRRWIVYQRGGVGYDNLPIILGEIGWWSPWRQYTFTPSGNTIWNESCMDEIAAFLRLMTKEHKTKHPRRE
jgi:hypothetical protein